MEPVVVYDFNIRMWTNNLGRALGNRNVDSETDVVTMLNSSSYNNWQEKQERLMKVQHLHYYLFFLKREI